MIKVVNLKKDMPDSSWAQHLMEDELHCSRLEGYEVIIFIHGHGAHGVGGEIKRCVHHRLAELKKNGSIVSFVPGEFFSDGNEEKQKICERFPQLILNSQVANLNSGITIVVL